MTRTALLAAAAAVLLPCAPSDAAGGRWCDPGYTGMVMYDAHGDFVTVCVRTSQVTAVVDAGEAQVQAWLLWATNRGPGCRQTPEGYICDLGSPPPLPPL